MEPNFSVIIATRNRPALFGRALQSVLAQPGAEIIVVNDGSAPQHREAYNSILSCDDTARVRSIDLQPDPKGHGCSYARNTGAVAATAPYLCFLDDDDCWTDPSHLERARKVIFAGDSSVDAYMTNQAAFLNDIEQGGKHWLSDMPRVLDACGNLPDSHGAHTVTVENLLQCGFCHLNTLIVRRSLYKELGGFDESIRWGEDLDFYLRLLDRARVVSRRVV